MPRLCLSFKDWRAEVAPHIGGSILSLTRARRAILRPTPAEAVQGSAVRHTACYPLVPYANRIAGGRFVWKGAAHRLRENFPASPHPLHGVGWRRPWQVVAVRENSCEIKLEHRPQRDGAYDWPFAFDAAEIITLGAQGLSVQLSVVNAQATDAPLGLGLHPLFPRRGIERLIFSATGAWVNDAEMLPWQRVNGGLWDHTTGQAVGAQELDNDFFGWQGAAVIEAVDAPTVRITASPIFSTLRVFTPPDKDFFAVEPVSHLTNAINRATESASMWRVPPGEGIAGTMRIDTDS